MDNQRKTAFYAFLYPIVLWGAIWGIFEATVGYLLHLLPISIGWLVYVPAACFFMTAVYKQTYKPMAVLCEGLFCAGIKMLDLLLPGRIDKVINPAISIVFEALAMTTVVLFLERIYKGKRHKGNPLISALTAVCVNTGWRLLYIFYLLWLVPNWMRDISVVSSAAKFIPFFVTQNLITSAILFIGYQFVSLIFKPVNAVEHKLTASFSRLPSRVTPLIKISAAILLTGVFITLQLLT